jgi:hypothetical protein
VVNVDVQDILFLLFCLSYVKKEKMFYASLEGSDSLITTYSLLPHMGTQHAQNILKPVGCETGLSGLMESLQLLLWLAGVVHRVQGSTLSHFYQDCGNCI